MWRESIEIQKEREKPGMKIIEGILTKRYLGGKRKVQGHE